MKYTPILCAAALSLLVACGGGVSRLSESPEPSSSPLSEAAEAVTLSSELTPPVNCPVELSQLPDRLIGSSADIWGEGSLFLLAQLPEEDISLYGMTGGEKLTGEEDTLILRQGDALTAFQLPWLNSRAILPQLWAGDYDGDGVGEVALVTYTGWGTGVSCWTLTMFERKAERWTARTLPDLSWQEGLSSHFSCEHTGEGEAVIGFSGLSLPVTLPEYADKNAPLEAYGGTIVEYEPQEEHIVVKLAVGIWQEEYIPYTCEYPAQLEGQLGYDGNGFTLISPSLSLYSD